MRVSLIPYKSASSSAAALSRMLGIKRIRNDNHTRFPGGPNRLVINWGASKVPDVVRTSKILNYPDNVGVHSNKKKFFRRYSNHNFIPNFYLPENDKDVIAEMIVGGRKLVGRRLLNASGGRGIELINTNENNSLTHLSLNDEADRIILENYINSFELVTEYIPKLSEYRIHFCKHLRHDPIFFTQKKLRRRETPDDQVNWQVRNYNNGFIFANSEELINGNTPTEEIFTVMDVARAMIHTCSIDFGAIDIIYNRERNRAYVLEINTAPGLTGSTLDRYTRMFRTVIREISETEERLHFLKSLQGV